MLAQLRVTNCRCFRDEQVLNLVATSDKEHREESTVTVTRPEAKTSVDLLKSAAIYGPNASGKSTLIEALTVMQNAVLFSSGIDPDFGAPAEPFMLDKKHRNEPSAIEIEFFLDGVRYQYGFSADQKRVQEEWLLAYPKGRAQVWFERSVDKKTGKSTWDFGSHLKGAKEALKSKTRDNALFLSVAARWNHEQLTKVYSWFKDKLQIINAQGSSPQGTAKLLDAFDNDKERYNREGKYIIALMRTADFGISGIAVKHITMEDIQFSENTPDEVKKVIFAKEEFQVVTQHDSPELDAPVLFPLHNESHGTQKFFCMLAPWIQALSTNSTLVVDEIDSSLHPALLRELIEMFRQPGVGGQLVLAMHDTTLLDPTLFRRDQIWFTDKGDDGASVLYSLASFKGVRKEEALQKGYLAGRYGAMPVIERFDTEPLVDLDGTKK